MREIPPEERTFEYYKAIITKYYNPTCETFTEEDFYDLKEKIKNGDEKEKKDAEKELVRKMTLLAYDEVGHMFAEEKLSGSFEKTLQNTQNIIDKYSRNAKTMNMFDRSLIDRTLPSFKKFVNYYIFGLIEKYNKIERHTNIDLNYEKVESLHNIEGEIGTEEDIINKIIAKERFLKAHELLKSLQPAELAIISTKFGFDGQGPKTFEQTAQKYGLDAQDVKEYEARALEKMRQYNAKSPSYVK